MLNDKLTGNMKIGYQGKYDSMRALSERMLKHKDNSGATHKKQNNKLY